MTTDLTFCPGGDCKIKQDCARYAKRPQNESLVAYCNFFEQYGDDCEQYYPIPWVPKSPLPGAQK